MSSAKKMGLSILAKKQIVCHMTTVLVIFDMCAPSPPVKFVFIEFFSVISYLGSLLANALEPPDGGRCPEDIFMPYHCNTL
jgi:hypothetical protein